MIAPNSDCTTCGGEGVDTDPYGCFDYECRGPCPDCWPEPDQVQVTQADIEHLAKYNQFYLEIQSRLN